MTMKRWNGSGYTDLTVAKRWNGSAWVDLTLAKRWNGSAWVDIPLPGGGGGGLSVTISPGYAFGEISVPNPPFPSAVTVASNNVTANYTGGSGTASVVWTRVSGSASVEAAAPTSFTTNFTANLTRNRTATAVFRATVTRGAETAYADVNVSLSYYAGTD